MILRSGKAEGSNHCVWDSGGIAQYCNHVAVYVGEAESPEDGSLILASVGVGSAARIMPFVHIVRSLSQR